VPSIISTIAGISTLVSVHTTEIGLILKFAGKSSSTSNISDATSVLSFPPLNPISQGRESVMYSSFKDSLISENTIWRLLRKMPPKSTEDAKHLKNIELECNRLNPSKRFEQRK
jgi:hypothetical protein